MNSFDRSERFTVPEGIKKVSYEQDTKNENAATFTLQREDHTVGNLIRMQLHRDRDVRFAGYKTPHPLSYKVEIKVQTAQWCNPLDAYNRALTDLDKELEKVKGLFEKELGEKAPELQETELVAEQETELVAEQETELVAEQETEKMEDVAWD